MFKATKKSFWMPSTHALNIIAGGGGGGSGFLYQASPALDANDTNLNTSFRVIVPMSGNSGTQIRATILPATINTLTVVNASIGKWNGDVNYPDTTAIPIELLFGGVSGFTSATTAKTSDWVNLSGLSFTSSDFAIVIFDCGGSGQGSQRMNSSSTGVTTWYKTGTPSYNLAATTGLGFTPISNNNYSVNSVETQ